MRGLTCAVLAAACALAAVACGDEDDEPETIPQSQLPELEPEDFICTEDDVPATFEYEVLSSGAVSDEEAASFSPEPEQRVVDYQEWGRVDGQFAAFSSEERADEAEEVAYFECAIDRYEDQAGARRALDAIAAALPERAEIALEGRGFVEISVEEIPSPQIGDETAAVSGTALKDGQPFQFFAVIFRRYNMVGYSLSAAPEKFSFVEDAANITALMVRLLDERVEEFEDERD
jgi:hypothetical protein